MAAAQVKQKTLQLQSVDRHDNLSREDFIEHYLKPGKPVVMRNFAKDWPALKKWSYDYLKKTCGDVKVPLYAEAFAGSGNDYLSSSNFMRFDEYLDLIQKGPSNLRMFLFNIHQNMPQLCEDFSYPDLNVSYLKKFPFMFFGGKGSHVDIHYDLDHSHVFLTQFEGKKRIILYGPDASTHLYRHPFTVSCNVDFRNPDLTRYPKVLDAKGYECIVEHGDTLFMPSRWWHFVDYTTTGFSLSLRAMPNGMFRRARGLWSIAKLKLMDNNLSKIIGPKKWYEIKEAWARKKAAKL